MTVVQDPLKAVPYWWVSIPLRTQVIRIMWMNHQYIVYQWEDEKVILEWWQRLNSL